jgi:uncharacterized protein with von Willebrand factor type A (vWA) domain
VSAVIARATALAQCRTMLTSFFLALRAGGLKPGVGEYLTLLQRGEGRAGRDVARALPRTRRGSTLVKDESQFDRFDRIFGASISTVSSRPRSPNPDKVPEEWLQQQMQRLLSDEEKARAQVARQLR